MSFVSTISTSSERRLPPASFTEIYWKIGNVDFHWLCMMIFKLI